MKPVMNRIKASRIKELEKDINAWWPLANDKNDEFSLKAHAILKSRNIVARAKKIYGWDYMFK